MTNEDRCRFWIRGVQCGGYRMPGSSFCALHGRGRNDRRDDEHSMRVDVLTPKRQERLDSLAGSEGPPAWSDEAGAIDVRLLCGVAGVVALALVVWLAWPYLVGAGVTFVGYRVATRGMRRRRPRSSWSSLGRTAAMMYAAWNSRWLKGSTFKASVPAAAGREHAPCGECGRDEPIPF